MGGHALSAAARGVLAAMTDFVLPRACVVCTRLLRAPETEVACGACWLAAQELPRPRCTRCGHPLDMRWRAASCQWCALLPPWVRSARSAYALPGGGAEGLVYALKYAGWTTLARSMARRMAALRFPADVEAERCALVPVPLARTRLRERGYNQSAELARWLGAHWGLPVWDDVLARTRATRSQTRLTPGERHRNVARAFVARADHGALRGLHLMLVDDVVTTAATLNACATALHDGGARILSFVTFGRAPAVGDRW